MPYTNTQHPSNTRTRVTIVLSIIFGVSIIPTTASGALYFSLENADVPTLYQEVRVKLRKDSTTDQDPKFEATDKIFFIKVTSIRKESCETASVVTLRSIVVAADGTAMATVIIKGPEFIVDQTYKMCYKKGGLPLTILPPSVSPAMYEEVSYRSPDGTSPGVPFTIASSIYTAHVMTPAIVYAGQGPVTLTITAKALSTPVVENRITQRPYVIPCPTGSCTSDVISAEDKNKMAVLCSKGNTGNQGSDTTGVVAGFGTVTLTTTFFAPVTPSASYGICVPYCFKAGSCDGAISWALVNSNTPIKFQPANPLH